MFEEILIGAWTFNSAKKLIPNLETYTSTEQFKNWRFVQLARAVHGDTYDYSNIQVANKTDKVKIVCPLHGEFEQSPKDHITRAHGCKKCANKMTREEFVSRALEVHGDRYDYSKLPASLPKSIEKVTILCKEHGEFSQEISSHLRGTNCPHCSNRALKTTETFVDEATALHGDAFDYSEATYTGNKRLLKVTCKTCNNVSYILPNNHLRGHTCKYCVTPVSKAEQEIENLILSFGYTTTKLVMPSGKHLDIVVEELGLAIEYNGMYWHSSEFKEKDYHLNKTLEAESLGYELIHIWESDYNSKKDIVENIILNKLGRSDRVYARDTEIAEITREEARDFLNSNHIQGWNNGATINLGLYFEGVLLQVVSLGKPRFGNKYSCDLELIRAATKLGVQVVGGISKLLKGLKSKKILSYCRRDYSSGKLYKAIGFTLVGSTPVDYWYTNRHGNCISRYAAMKHKLPNLLENFKEELTEETNMKNHGYHKVYGCGNLIFIKEPV